VTNALGVNICNGSHQLVRIKLHNQVWDLLLHFEILFHHSIGSVGNKVHDNVKVDFFGLISISVEALSHFDTIWVMEHLQNSEFTIFVSLVLEYLLDEIGRAHV
jgi:hypothetical protein